MSDTGTKVTSVTGSVPLRPRLRLQGRIDCRKIAACLTEPGMSHLRSLCVVLLFIFPCFVAAQEVHSHSAAEKLGHISFPISCLPTVQRPFDRGVALLHSFAYSAAEDAFRGVAEVDPQCAMAHWGM